MLPAVGVKAPEMQLKQVDWPEPLGPMRPRISPSLTPKDTEFRAVKPPNCLVSALTVSRGVEPERGAPAPRQRDRNGEDVGSSTGGLARLAITGGYTCLNSPSTTWKTAAKARMFWPAIGCPAGWNLTPYPCIVPPSGMSVSRAAAASASGPKPPCFWMARGSTSDSKTYRLLKPIETCGAIAAVGALASYCVLYRFTISAVRSPTAGLSFVG